MFKMTLIVFIINKVICVCLVSYKDIQNQQIIVFLLLFKEGKTNIGI